MWIVNLFSHRDNEKALFGDVYEPSAAVIAATSTVHDNAPTGDLGGEDDDTILAETVHEEPYLDDDDELVDNIDDPEEEVVAPRFEDDEDGVDDLDDEDGMSEDDKDLPGDNVRSSKRSKTSKTPKQPKLAKPPKPSATTTKKKGTPLPSNRPIKKSKKKSCVKKILG